MSGEWRAAYLAPRGLSGPLEAELPKVQCQVDRLLITEAPPQESRWAQNVWLKPEVIHFQSVGEAARALKARQRNWWPFLYHHPRRAKLIQEQLPHISAKRHGFLEPDPAGVLGSWTLLDANTMLASGQCTSPYPNGEMEFAEDKESPPSRAYLKLWELFSRIPERPGVGDVCIDMGASPGGWTWVLAKLGAQVLAFDRAPLAPALMNQAGISWQKGDAFKIRPGDFPELTWLFSDMACYPEKLREFLEPWIQVERPVNLVCTLKFQGDNPYGVLADFLAVPGTQCGHLYHNKHELTWVRLASRRHEERSPVRDFHLYAK